MNPSPHHDVLQVHCDGDIFARQPHGGIRRSTECLVQGLSRREDVRVTVQSELDPIGKPPEIGDALVRAMSPPFRIRPAKLFMRPNHAIARAHAERFWNAPSQGLFLSTYYTTHAGLRIPQASVIHDMIYERFPDATVGTWHQKHREAKLRSVALADLILCPSRSAHDDLRALCEVSGKQLHVVPWGVDRWFRRSSEQHALAAARAKWTGGAPYLLYVGGRAGTKNFNALLIAYARWRRNRDFTLLSVGGGAFTNEENCLLRALRMTDRVHCVPALGNDELVVAYSAAAGCVMPSLYEGFGFPVAESLACDTPVACARISSLPEVGGDAACYFDPSDQEELIAALDALVDLDRESERHRAGVARWQSRDWDVVAGEYAAAMRAIL